MHPVYLTISCYDNLKIIKKLRLFSTDIFNKHVQDIGIQNNTSEVIEIYINLMTILV